MLNRSATPPKIESYHESTGLHIFNWNTPLDYFTVALQWEDRLMKNVHLSSETTITPHDDSVRGVCSVTNNRYHHS